MTEGKNILESLPIGTVIDEDIIRLANVISTFNRRSPWNITPELYNKIK